MKTKSFMAKQVLMSTLAAAAITFGFTACSDEADFTAEASQPVLDMETRAGASNYNINYHNVIFGGDKQAAKPFDTKNWQKESAIFCYVGKGGDEDIYDSTYTVRIPGFEHVNLPWSDDATSCNIPENIWKEVNPDPDATDLNNPWHLVLMNCGKQNVADGNFLGFYNEISGVLRIFVYVPKNVDAKGGTHMWGVKLNDVLASRSIFRYGVPMDRSITSDEAKKKLSQSNDMSQVISPWKEGKFTGFSNSALCPGWWAFDVDLSMYRNLETEGTIANLNNRSSALTVQALSRTDSKLEMKSDLLAQIQGSMDLKATQANTENGIFAPFEEVLGKANDAYDLFNLAKTIANPNPLEAFETGLKLAKGACNLVGIDYGKTTEGFNGYKGQVNLSMDGTINSNGIISTPENVSGFNPISFKHDNFLMDNCKTFGEGIWNLETAPVVYYTDAMVQWKYEYIDHPKGVGFEFDPSYIISANKKSPFNAQKKTDSKMLNVSTSKDPWCGYVCFFDPSSIKLQLNGNVFTPDEIKNAKVYATCGVRKANSTFGSLETYRDALNLKDSKRSVDFSKGFRFINRGFDEVPFNALSRMEGKMDMGKVKTFPATKFDGHNCGVFGYGDDDYLLEPTPLSGDDHPLMCYMPNYEVSVTVVINHNGKNIVYSRTYLPEYKMASISNIEALHNDVAKHRPANYDETIYTMQAEHIHDIAKWTHRTLVPNKIGTSLAGVMNETATRWDNKWDKTEEAWTCLVDGDVNTKWQSHNWGSLFPALPESYMKDKKMYTESAYKSGAHAWICEFKSIYPLNTNPASYTLVTAADNDKNHIRRPRVWALLGKAKESDKWTVLAEENTTASGGRPTQNALPHTSLTHVKYEFNKAKPQNYQFFRFEVLHTWDECWKGYLYSTSMQLAELYFNYND